MRNASQELPVRPTCVIGCGGRGCEVVCEAIEYLAGDPRAPEASREHRGLFGSFPPFWVPLGIDAFRDPREHRRLAAGRFFDLDPGNLAAMIDRVEAGEEPYVAEWLEWQVAMAALSGWGMEGRRQLGRLAYDLRRRDIRSWLDRIHKDDLATADLDARVQQWQTEVDVSPHYVVDARQPVEVVLVSSLCGGTGSSILLPLAADIRDTFGSVSMTAVLFMPESFGINDSETRSMIEANAYACLKEVDHFMREGNYRAVFRDGDEIQHRRPLFDCIYLVSATRRHNTLSVPDLLAGVARFIASMAIRPGGFGIVSRYVNYRDLRQSTLDNNGKRRCYSFLGSSERLLSAEGVERELASLIFEDVLDSLAGQVAESGGAGEYAKRLVDVLSDANIDVNTLQAPQSKDVYDSAHLPPNPSSGQANSIIREARQEATGANNAALRQALEQTRRFVQECVTQAVRAHLEAAVADRGIAAGLDEIGSSLRWAQEWRADHQTWSEQANQRLEQLRSDELNVRQQLVRTRDKSEVRALAERLCRVLTDAESSRMAAEYHRTIVGLLADSRGQLEEWGSALRRNADHIGSILSQRSRWKRGRSSSRSVAVAFREYLWEEKRGLWDDVRKAMGQLLFRHMSEQELERNMLEGCANVLTEVALGPEQIIVNPDGNPSHFLNSAIDEAEPYWNPDSVAVRDNPPVQLMSMEVNGKDLPDLTTLAQALQVGTGRDVETRQGFLNGASFLIMRAEVGASVSYLPQIKEWYASYQRMLDVLRAGRRSERPQGRQPHTEKQYESQCEDLVAATYELRDEDLLAFGLGLTAKLVEWDMESLCYSVDGALRPIGKDYRDAVSHCVRHALIDEMARRAREFLREQADTNTGRALILERHADTMREEIAQIASLAEEESGVRLRVAAQLDKLATTFREAR